MTSTPSVDDTEDLLLSCRYGDLADLREYTTKFGADSLSTVRDEHGNTILHMCSGNGHTGKLLGNSGGLIFSPSPRDSLLILMSASSISDVLGYLLAIVSPALLSAQNESLSTALHWAALNSHMEIVKKLVEFKGGPGIDLIDIKNKAGHTPLGEAESAGWNEGAQYLVQMMRLDNVGAAEIQAGESEEDVVLESGQNVEVEIEDADGQIAKMTLVG